MVIVFVLVMAFWLVWALMALPIAGIAKIRHNDPLAAKMIRSLAWNFTGRKTRRR
jgi:hypothetical protein